MGDAKRRGDYATRKAEAIKAGRVKVTPQRRPFRLLSGPELFAGMLALISIKRAPKKPVSTGGM